MTVQAQIDDAALEAARQRGKALPGPMALSARYEASGGRVVLELSGGCSFAFPARGVEGLGVASDAQLGQLEVSGGGYGLHWPALDIDVSVPGLLSGLFGTQAWTAREQARRAGATRSVAKSAAARSNGAKGGRPLKRTAV